jgi:hypothetical protein
MVLTCGGCYNMLKIGIGKNAKSEWIELNECEQFSDFGNYIESACKSGIIKNKLAQPYFVATGDWNWVDNRSKRTKNDLLSTAKYGMIIIDGDEPNDDNGLISANWVHNALMQLGINHFVYTSWSNGIAGKNKWRAVIECYDGCPIKYLHATTKDIVDRLNVEHTNIAYASENHSPVRIWFFGGSELIDKAEFHSYYEGNSLDVVFKEMEIEKEQDKNADSAKNDYRSLDDMVNKVIEWKSGSGLWDTIREYGWGVVKDGLKKRNAIVSIQSFMKNCPEIKRDEQWQKYYEDIERMVDGAIIRCRDELVDGNGSNNINIDDFKTNRSDSVASDADGIPWPPGLFGRLCQNIYEMQTYQYREVAIVTAVGLVAGIAGRKFNVSRTGLNVYLTLLMGTGKGKDSIGKIIRRILLELNDIGQGSSFIGNSRFTGPKGLIDSLVSARSQVCIFTEAGILMQSSAGDQSGLTRVLLGLYGTSGERDISSSEAYSRKEDGIPAIRNPALSIINEATPETLLDALKDSNSLDNGLLPRQSVFRIIGKKPYENENVREFIDDDIMSILRKLVVKCASIQSEDNCVGKVWHFGFEDMDEKRSHSKLCTDVENDNDGTTKGVMASRMHMKTMKFAAIATVINKSNYHKDDRLLIGGSEWEWAKRITAYELAGIEQVFSGSDFSNAFEDVTYEVIVPFIYKILSGGFTDFSMARSPLEIEHQLIPYKLFTRSLRKNKKLVFQKTIRSPIDGLDNILQYMLNMGYLTIKESYTATSRPYKGKTRSYDPLDCFKIQQWILDSYKDNFKFK